MAPQNSVRSLSPYLCILPNLGFVARCTFLQYTPALKPLQSFARVFCISFFFPCLNYSSLLFLFTSVKRQRHFWMAANAYMCCQFVCYLCSLPCVTIFKFRTHKKKKRGEEEAESSALCTLRNICIKRRCNHWVSQNAEILSSAHNCSTQTDQN